MTNEHQNNNKAKDKLDKKSKLSLALLKNINRRKSAKKDSEENEKK